MLGRFFLCYNRKIMNSDIEIIPALMPKTFDELVEQFSRLRGYARMVQLDVMDNMFVPNMSWPYLPHHRFDPHFDAILAESEDMPFWEDIEFEADLMVSTPEYVWKNWLHAGAKRLIIHLESLESVTGHSTDKLAKLVHTIQANNPSPASFLHVDIGIAINTTTPNERLHALLEKSDIDFVQFMGISRIGFQGESFDHRVLAKIRDLRAKFPHVTISVDGGVNLKTAPELIAAGANRLVVGSAIMGRTDIEAAFEDFDVVVDGATREVVSRVASVDLSST